MPGLPAEVDVAVMGAEQPELRRSTIGSFCRRNALAEFFSTAHGACETGPRVCEATLASLMR